MAFINKIKIRDEEYHIVAEIGKGLQFGTSLSNMHKTYVTLGTPIIQGGNSVTDCGIKIHEGNFTLDAAKFTAFLKDLGFKTE